MSHAPAIQGDFKTWFENAKWVKSETWPQVAAEVLAFVRECLAKPHDLRDAIARFTASPLSKGFNVGMLTPILNALAPDDLPLVNAKVTRVVSYFSGVELEATLADYVTTARSWRTLVDSQPQLQDPRLGVSAGDAFDHFCHWLVARSASPSPAVAARRRLGTGRSRPGGAPSCGTTGASAASRRSAATCSAT
ncbi:MAG: hypothetical protein IPL61_22055 [Myxococcales bacterium]|nr:hypothetical protein [Myxococcales bacterium]